MVWLELICYSAVYSSSLLVFHGLFLFVQDRFQHIVPTLNKLGNLTVGLTLMLIGVLGIVESRQHNQEVAQQLQPITPEGSVIKGEYKRVYSSVVASISTSC